MKQVSDEAWARMVAAHAAKTGDEAEGLPSPAPPPPVPPQPEQAIAEVVDAAIALAAKETRENTEKINAKLRENGTTTASAPLQDDPSASPYTTPPQHLLSSLSSLQRCFALVERYEAGEGRDVAPAAVAGGHDDQKGGGHVSRASEVRARKSPGRRKARTFSQVTFTNTARR